MRPRRLVPVVLLASVASVPLARAEKPIDINKQLRLLERGVLPPLEIPGARYRVAVFNYEDPDGTGLGNAFAALVGREILVRSKVGSIGILRYQGGLSPSAGEDLSYFDKVEKLASAQQATLAVWGVVQRSGSRLVVDTFVQLPPATRERAFRWAVLLPSDMGGGKLVAHLDPDRILVQTIEVPAEDVPSLRKAAETVDELRAEPRDTAAVVARILVGTGYWVDKTDGDWIHMDSGTQGKGWARVAEHCTGRCRPLLDAARFAAGLLQFMEFRNVRVTAAESLAADARAVGDQLTALEALDADPEQVEALALGTASRWLEAGTPAAGAVPPGGAAFANVRAMGRVVLALKRAAQERRPLALDPEQVRSVAYELAEIALVDPRNTDVLGNLEVLFTYAGDSARAALAKRLASEAAAQRPASER